MTIAWLLYVLLVGALLCAGAAALSSAASALRRPTRGVWSAALAGIVLLGVIAPREKLLQVRYEPAGSIGAPSSPRASAPTRADRGVRDAWEALGRGSTSLIASLERRVPRAIELPLLVAWAIASVLLVALFAAVNARAARARRGWPLQLLHGVTARIAPATGPAVLGLARPEIVVPRSLLERSDDEQRLILSHEREHVRAGDHLLLAAGWLVVIALPWHPAVWYLLARLRLAIELDCDARVLRAGASPRSYGTLLIEVAAHAGGSRIGALALADGPSQLERRIRAMNGSRKRYGAASAAVACAIGAVLVLVACEAKIPTSAEIAQMDVAGAQRSAAEGGFLRTPSKTAVDYFINGAPVSGEQARALEARQIGSIEVVRSEPPTGRDTIFVTTADRMPRPLLRTHAGEAFDNGRRETNLHQKVMADSAEHTVAHVERELAGVRTRDSDPTTRIAPRRSMRRTPSTGEPEPVITIDGRIATEAQLAALDTRDIASIAIYKGKEGEMLLRSSGKKDLEVTSAPPRGIGGREPESLIAVTTKMARAQTKRP
jgi:beta-lactamase regulating signal transducer with metallopeptidase domain